MVSCHHSATITAPTKPHPDLGDSKPRIVFFLGGGGGWGGRELSLSFIFFFEIERLRDMWCKAWSQPYNVALGCTFNAWAASADREFTSCLFLGIAH